MNFLHSVSQLLEEMDPLTIHRGQTYYSQGRIKNYKISTTKIEAQVQGNQRHPYNVTIEDEGTDDLFCDCSCPIGFHCKHIAAVILHAIANKSTPLAEAKPTLQPQEQMWLNHMRQENQPVDVEIDHDEFVIYILNPQNYRTSLLQILEIAHTKNLKKMQGFKKPSGKTRLNNTYGHLSIDRYMNDIDRNLVMSLLSSKYLRTDEVKLLEGLIDTGRLFWKEAKFGHALQRGEPKNGILEWELKNDSLSPKIRGETDNVSTLLLSKKFYYIDSTTNTIGLLQFPCSIETVEAFLAAPHIRYNRASILQTELSKIAPYIPPLIKEEIKLPSTDPIPHLNVTVSNPYSNHYMVKGSLSFLYGDHEVTTNLAQEDVKTFHSQGKIYHLERNRNAEYEAGAVLITQNWVYQNHREFLLNLGYEANPNTSLAIKVHELRKAGWVIDGNHKALETNVVVDPEWYGDVSETANNWFDLEIGSVIDGKKVNLGPALLEVKEKLEKRKEIPEHIALTTKDGEILVVPYTRIKKLLDIFFQLLNPKIENGKVSFSHAQIPSLTSQTNDLAWKTPLRYQELEEKFNRLSSIPKVAAPSSLSCELRPYQIDGLSWMQFLSETQLGGVLADDMGLGKTVQTLAHILTEKESGRMKHPALIIAPTSLMNNWMQETKKFAPQLSVLILQGLDRKRFFTEISLHDIVLTTYPLLVRDEDQLLKQEFYFLILDEAQTIKNAKTKAHQVLRQINAKHRLCLTGTPMENHLGELWSLFHILLPGFLGTEKQFQTLFRKPIEKEGSLERQSLLQTRIRPFLLRRTKEEVAQDLPQKTEIVVPIELTETQKDLYEAVRLTMMQKVLSHVQEKGLAKSHIVLLDALLKLRQICCDPRLIKQTKETHTKEHSAKLTYLLEVIPQMIEEKRQILLFSQFTSMLELIQEELKALSIPYALLTGDTIDRKSPIEAFQSGQVPLFLISLKAGGTGLNLTAADTVIHYDPWWNPAVEAQATARAHRIGQSKPVFVYKWIASGGVEEKILQLQERKKSLVNRLLEESENQMVDLSEADIQTLFAPLESFINAG